jgi:hypothetical protein
VPSQSFCVFLTTSILPPSTRILTSPT